MIMSWVQVRDDERRQMIIVKQMHESNSNSYKGGGAGAMDEQWYADDIGVKSKIRSQQLVSQCDLSRPIQRL